MKSEHHNQLSLAWAASKKQLPVRAFSSAALLALMLVNGFAAGTESIPDPPWLHDKLEAVRKAHELPAIGCCGGAALSDRCRVGGWLS